ncbi:hypothetical protein [Alloalcanivorax mobilis]|uniref:hypothetical protein n=1 Tax=Alloalcanivorax mobilis TaxID=2019569 RepID=UPI000C76AC41|nr:hypothetical protein [Alloalcanivorax mobilis]
MMKKAVLSLEATAAMFIAVSANAVTFIPVTPNNPYVFSGEIRLDNGLTNPPNILICNLSLTGNVSEDSSGSTKGTVIVTSGTVAGAFPCALITLENLPRDYEGNITLTSTGTANQNVLFANPSNKIQVFP